MSTRAPHPMDDELRRFLDGIVDSMDEMVIVTNATLDIPGPLIVFVNHKFTEVTGYTPDEIVGQSPRILQGPATDRAVLNRLRYDLEHHQRFRGEVVNYRKDGSTYVVEWRVLPLRNTDGEITHWLSLQRAITATRTDEAPLRESEARFRAVWECSPDAMVITDPAGTILAVNPAYERLYGIPAHAALGQSFSIIFPPERRDYASERYQEVFQAPHPPTIIEVRLQHADGTERFVESHAGFVTDGEQRIAMLSIVHDITGRKQIEADLRSKTLLLERITEASPDLIFVYDLAQRRAVYVSQQITALLGYDVDHFQRLDYALLTELIHPDDRAAIRDEVAGMDSAPEGAIFGLQFRVRAADGNWRWFHSRGTLLPQSVDDGSRQLLGIARDITFLHEQQAERRAMERRLVEAQKIESLRMMAGGIAHDFNNLLAPILGFAGLVRMDLPRGSSVHADLREIEIAAQRAAELTQQMLAYVGKAPFTTKGLNLNAIVKEMRQLIRSSIPTEIELVTTLGPEMALIEGDATGLRQVILNLVTNAAEALAPVAGRIEVRTSVQLLDSGQLAATYLAPELPAGRYVVLDVVDNGAGIDETMRQKIFDPFFTTKFTGRGLGLAVVLGIVRQHSGAVNVVSQAGQGSTFSIMLPAVTEPVTAPQLEVATTSNPQDWQEHGTVLVVDDDAVVQSLLIRVLGRIGFTVLTAAAGHRAVEIVQTDGGQLLCVLLNLRMPGVSGHETFHAIQRLEPDLPVVVMSGYEADEVLTQFAGANIAGFLHKPFTIDELRAQLSGILHRRIRGPSTG